MKVQIQVKHVFGMPKAYPMNDTAKLFAKIAGTKTLTNYTLTQIKAMGIEIVTTVNSPIFWADVD